MFISSIPRSSTNSSLKTPCIMLVVRRSPQVTFSLLLLLLLLPPLLLSLPLLLLLNHMLFAYFSTRPLLNSIIISLNRLSSMLILLFRYRRLKCNHQDHQCIHRIEDLPRNLTNMLNIFSQS